MRFNDRIDTSYQLIQGARAVAQSAGGQAMDAAAEVGQQAKDPATVVAE